MASNIETKTSSNFYVVVVWICRVLVPTSHGIRKQEFFVEEPLCMDFYYNHHLLHIGEGVRYGISKMASSARKGRRSRGHAEMHHICHSKQPQFGN